MYRRNPSSIVFEHDGNWWIESTTRRAAVDVSEKTGAAIAQLRADMDVAAFELEALDDLNRLIDEGILVGSEDAGAGMCGYHAATRDHPFLDMSTGMAARITDAMIMGGYVEADDYPPVYLDIEHHGSIRLEDAADLGIDELRNSDLYQFSLILSGTLGVRRRQPHYYDPRTEYHQVELVQKSIPSGGGRHPTELFVEVLRSPVIPSGKYHYQPRTNTLDRLSPDAFQRADSVSEDSGADWVVRLYLASAVRRAMFRYRDPRSFRAILVDLGHADAQFAALSAYCNWRYRSGLNVRMNFATVADDESTDLPLLMTGLLEGWS